MADSERRILSTVVVTGANRGIGLGLCKALQARGHVVLAACRTESDELRRLTAPSAESGIEPVEVISGIDVVSDQGCRRLADAVAGRQVELLILNAGLLQKDALDTMDFASLQQQFEVNALGPLRVVAALRGQLGSGSKVALISSKMGSLTANVAGGMYGYRMSKAAANMGARSLAADLRDEGIAVAMLHPGAVDTDLFHTYHAKPGARQEPGSQAAFQAAPQAAPQSVPLTVQQSVWGLIGCIDGLSIENTGRFWTAENGSELEW